MKNTIAISLAVCTIVALAILSLISTQANSDKSDAYEAVGAYQPAEEVGASMPVRRWRLPSHQRIPMNQSARSTSVTMEKTTTYLPAIPW